MKKHALVADVVKLSVAERIRVVEDIWDSIAGIPEAVPVTKEQKKELNKRLAAYRGNPKRGCSWQGLKQRLHRRYAI